MSIEIGQKFEQWTIVGRAPDQRVEGRRGAAANYWMCRCACGTEREVSERSLDRGTSTSCGCSRRDNPTKKLMDLTGQPFGRWTVIGRGDNRGQSVYWICRCACGTEKEIEGRSLRGGRSTSCNCQRIEKSKAKKGILTGNAEDLTNKLFGKWTILGLAYRRYPKSGEGGPLAFWNAKCKCGTEKIVGGASLKGGHSQSCGCTPYTKDLAGKEFGRLKAVVTDGRTKCGHVRWLCNCICGNTVCVASNKLVVGAVASCGCAKRDGAIVRPEKYRKAKSQWTNQQYRDDISFNLNRRVSAMVRLALRRVGTKKGGRHWPDMVGYTVDELRTHLENTMPIGYTWDDYLLGKLHIDHKIPLAAFNYELFTDIDFQRAWSLSNLRLLPGPENMLKNARLEAPFQPSLAFG